MALSIADEDAEARQTVSQLLKNIVFEPVDIGKPADSEVMKVGQVL